jgi:hypothetical protein
MAKNIDQITRTLTTLTGAERMVFRDDDGDGKAVLQSTVLDYLTSGVLDSYIENLATSGVLDSYIKANSEPIGTVKDWNKSFPDTPALDATWKECDGSVIDDVDSPYNGRRIDNLNGANVSFTVTWASGVATVSENDVSGIGVGDSVAGSGIASGAYITVISGTTVTMSDTAFSGTVDTTFANDGRFIGGGTVSGVSKRDNVPNIEGELGFRNNSAGQSITLGIGTGLVKSAAIIAGSTYTLLETSSSTSANRTEVSFDASNDTTLGATKYTSENSVHPMHTKMVKIMKIKNTL